MIHTLAFNGSSITFNAQEKDIAIITRIATELITLDGFKNLKPEDVKEILDGAENLTVAECTASGHNKAKIAAQEALKNIYDAERLLIEVASGPDITLGEMQEGADVILSVAPEVPAKSGYIIDETLDGKVRVSVIAITAPLIWGHVIDEDIGDKITVRL